MLHVFWITLETRIMCSPRQVPSCVPICTAVLNCIGSPSSLPEPFRFRPPMPSAYQGCAAAASALAGERRAVPSVPSNTGPDSSLVLHSTSLADFANAEARLVAVATVSHCGLEPAVTAGSSRMSGGGGHSRSSISGGATQVHSATLDDAETGQTSPLVSPRCTHFLQR